MARKKKLTEAEAQMFYRSSAWLKMRKEILKRDNHECQLCKQRGKVSRGEVVHHIKHLKSYPQLALSVDNLITLCGACHSEVHPEKGVGVQVKPTHSEKWE